jgi:hypothetical protein
MVMAEADVPRRTDDKLAAALNDIEKLAPSLCGHASRSASERLDAVQRILAYRVIETYEPDDKAGFASVMEKLSAHIPDSSALSGLFGVSVSTLYRWRSGDSVPHKLVRAAVKEHLLRLLHPPAGERRFEHSPGHFAN